MILLYHLIFSDDTPPGTWNAGNVLRLSDFRKQLIWLQKHFHIVSLKEYLSQPISTNNDVVITFDDGYRKTIELVLPIIEAQGIPVTFFLNTSHLEDGNLLWFVYINALCFEKIYDSLQLGSTTYPLHTKKQCYLAWQTLINQARSSRDPISFSKNVAKNYPLPEAVTNAYMGVSEEQIAALGKSQLMDIGGHTHSHPYLNQLTMDQLLAEVRKNKQLLEYISQKEVHFFAYPGGVYDQRAIEAVKHVGFQAALAINPKNLGNETQFEIKRVGIYSPSILKLRFKMSGIVNLSNWTKE